MIRRTAIRPELVFGVLLVLGGAALLANGVLHLLRHAEFLGWLLGGALAAVLGLTLAVDALAPSEGGPPKRSRVRFSKRMRSGHLLVIILAFASSLMGQQTISGERPGEAGLMRGAPSQTKVMTVVAAKRAQLARKYDITHVGNRGIGRGANLYSTEKELRLGSKLANAVDSSARLVSDPAINRVRQPPCFDSRPPLRRQRSLDREGD